MTTSVLNLPLNTPRLRLRPFLLDDVDAVHSYRSLPEVARFLYHPPLDEAECRDKLEQRKNVRFLAGDDGLVLAVEVRETGRVVGELNLTWTNQPAMQAEIGWIFHPDAGGKGYATEAAKALIGAGFQQAGFHRVFARLDEENTASARLCERLGMRCEAKLIESDLRVSYLEPEGVYGTELVYAILKREWAG